MNKTKVVVSISPMSYQEGILEEMIINGADTIRLNLSYSDYNFCEKVISELNIVNKKLSASTALMLDIEGPSIRTEKIKEDQAYFKTGDKIRMYMNSVLGSNVQFSVNYSELIKYIKTHTIIKLSEGNVILEAVEKGLDYVVLEVIKGGIVRSFTKIEIPNVKINRDFLTKQIKEDIIFATKVNANYILVSNVTSAEDILEINDLLIQFNNGHTLVIAKIQNDLAVKDLDKIISVCDGIAIDRNDLAMTIPIEKIPAIKKEFIQKNLNSSKISIISADVESFLNEKSVLSRAEVSDLATTVSLGVDAIMLSGETTIGHYPIEAIKQVTKIIKESEQMIDHDHLFKMASKTEIKNIAGTIASSAVSNSAKLNCKAIVAVTANGMTAKQISRFRPKCIIIAIVPNEIIAKNLSLYFGVISIVSNEDNFDVFSSKWITLAQQLLQLSDKDKIIIVGQQSHRKNKQANFIKIEEI